MTRYLSLAEYLWLSEQVTGISAEVLSQSSRIELADSALHAPMSGFGDEDACGLGDSGFGYSLIVGLFQLIQELLRCIMDEPRGTVLRGSRKPRRASPRIL